MNMLKKVTAVALAAAIVMVPVRQVAAQGLQDQATAEIKKKYELANKGTSPAEKVALVQVGTGSYSIDGQANPTVVAPTLKILDGEARPNTVAVIELKAGAAGQAAQVFSIPLPEANSFPKPGVYEYKLREAGENKPGVSYHAGEIVLKVTVVDDGGFKRIVAVHAEEGANGTAAAGTKLDTITNRYTAGELTLKKMVAGTLGDKKKEFSFTVKFTGEKGKTYEKIMATGGSATGPLSFTVGESQTVKLKHNETLTFSNIPAGVTYEIVETEADGYVTTATNDGKKVDAVAGGARTLTGKIEAPTDGDDGVDDAVIFTNTKDGEVDTGVLLDNAPYVLLLAVAIGGGALLLKKRSEEV